MMTGREWRTRKLSGGITRQTLHLTDDFELSVDFCHAEDDPNCAAPTTAFADLRFHPMYTSVCSRVVMNGNEGWAPGERMLRSRQAAIQMARQWRNSIQKPVRRLERVLKNAEG